MRNEFEQYPLAIKNKFAGNTYEDRKHGRLNYRWFCIDKMNKLKVGESMQVDDRTREIVKRTWLWKASRISGFEFLVHSVDKFTQIVKRVK